MKMTLNFVCTYYHKYRYILLNNLVSLFGIFNSFGNTKVVVFSLAEN